MADILHKNMKTLRDLRGEYESKKSSGDRVANRVTSVVGSLSFIVINAVFFLAWIAWNSGVFPVPAFDHPPFVGLALSASIEAIFLSIFILMSQNEMSKLSEKRAELDLQISLLTEGEVTELIRLTEAIAEKVGVDSRQIADVDELKKDIQPDAVLREIEEHLIIKK